MRLFNKSLALKGSFIINRKCIIHKVYPIDDAIYSLMIRIGTFDFFFTELGTYRSTYGSYYSLYNLDFIGMANEIM